jgi:hypothetical protein
MLIKRYLLLVSLFSVITAGENTANFFDFYYPSARAGAMGGAQTAVTVDNWSPFYNPAGLVRMQTEFQLGAAYYQLYNLSGMEAVFGSFGMRLPGKYGHLGVSIQNLGVSRDEVDLSTESVYQLSHAIFLMKDVNSSLSLGYNIKAMNLELGESIFGEDLGSEMVFGLDVGMQANLYRRFWLGFSATNINNPKLGKVNAYDMPRRYTVGLGYTPFSGVTTALDFRVNEGEDMQILAGMEYYLIEELAIRAGIVSEPSIFSLGLGVNVASIRFDYAFESHPVLDDTHQFTLMYGF